MSPQPAGSRERLSGAALVSVVESPNLRYCDDTTQFRLLHSSGLWRILAQGEMRPEPLRHSDRWFHTMMWSKHSRRMISRCPREWWVWTGCSSSTFCAHSFSDTFWLNIAVWKKS